MIFISQGHEKSIGLEIFLKALSLIDKREHSLFHLVCYKDSLEETESSLSLAPSSPHLARTFLSEKRSSQSLNCLEYCLENVSDSDFLITLPTSKDQLPQKGYTEFLRHHYKADNLAMAFHAPDELSLLITDHIPLKRVPEILEPKMIVSKVENCLKSYARLEISLKEVLFAGLNPHAGENGLLGSEEDRIKEAIESLEKKFPQIAFKGPYPGDTLHFYQKNASEQLNVYMYHDQGLAKFKSTHGVIGINMTLGLPFFRFSVDHGTAFDIYQKDRANYMGMYYLLIQSLKFSRMLQ